MRIGKISKERVHAVSKAFTILKMVANSESQNTITSIARSTGIKISSCFYLVNTLLNLGYLRPGISDRTYALGYRGVQQAKVAALQGLSYRFVQEAQRMANFYDASIIVFRPFSETAYISTWVAEGRSGLGIRINPGCEFPLFHGSTGRINAAHLPLDDKQYRAALAQISIVSDAEVGDFRDTIDQLRQQDCFVDQGATRQGVASMAVPAFDATGSFCGSVEITTFETRFRAQNREQLLADLIALRDMMPGGMPYSARASGTGSPVSSSHSGAPLPGVEPDDQSARKRVNSVVAAARLIALLYDSDIPLRASEISGLAEMPNSTCRKFLTILVQERIVSYDPDTKRYRPGLRLLNIAQSVLTPEGLNRIVAFQLMDYARRHNVTVVIWRRSKDRLVAMNYFDGGGPLTVQLEAGFSLPLLSGAFGTIVAAWGGLPLEELTAAFEQSSHNLSKTFDAFLEELDTVRERGWVYDVGVVHSEFRTLAVPLGELGRVERVLSATMLLDDQSPPAAQEMREELTEISRLMDSMDLSAFS